MKKILVGLMLLALLLGNMPGQMPLAHAQSVEEEIAATFLPWAMPREEFMGIYPDALEFSYQEAESDLSYSYWIENAVTVAGRSCNLDYGFTDKGLFSVRCDNWDITNAEEALNYYYTLADSFSSLFCLSYGIEWQHTPYWEDESKKSQYGDDLAKALEDGAISQVFISLFDANEDWYCVWVWPSEDDKYIVSFELQAGEETLEAAWQQRQKAADQPKNGVKQSTGGMTGTITSTITSAAKQTDTFSLLPAPWGSSLETVNASLDFQGTQDTYQVGDENRQVDYPVLLVNDVNIHGIPFYTQYGFSADGLYSCTYSAFARSLADPNMLVYELGDAMDAFYALVDEVTEEMKMDAFFTYQWEDEDAEKQYSMRVDKALGNGKLTSITAYFENAEQFCQFDLSAESFSIYCMSLTVPTPLETTPALGGEPQAAAPQSTAVPELPTLDYRDRVGGIFEIQPGFQLDYLYLYLAAGMIMVDDYTEYSHTDSGVDISFYFDDAEYRMNYSTAANMIYHIMGEVTPAKQEWAHYQATYEMIHSILEEMYGAPWLTETGDGGSSAHFYAADADVEWKFIDAPGQEYQLIYSAKINENAFSAVPTAAPAAAAATQRVKPAGLSLFSFDWGCDMQTVKNGLPKYTETTANLYAGSACTPYPYIRSSLQIGDYKFQTGYAFSGAGLFWVDMWLNSANKGTAYAAYNEVIQMFEAYCVEGDQIETICNWKNSKAEQEYEGDMKAGWRNGKITEIITDISLPDAHYQVILNDMGITVGCNGILIPTPLESAP